MHVRTQAQGLATEFLRYVFTHKVTVEAVEASNGSTAPCRCSVQVCPVNEEAVGSCLCQGEPATVGEPVYASGRWHLDAHDEVCGVYQGQVAGDNLFLGIVYKDGWI